MIKKITSLKTSTCGVLFVFALLFSGLSSNAQTVEIIPSYGYQFGAKLKYGYNNYLKVQDSDQWGISLGVETFDDTMVELSYVHQGSTIRVRDIPADIPDEERLADVSGDWIMIGGTRYFPNGNIRPFLGAALGIVIVSPSNENREIINRSLSNDTNFAFSFKGGVNIMFSEHVGINIQGNLMFPVNYGGFYVGTGGGGAYASSTVIMGGFSGGLVFRI
ncbi:outer membrane beta-barrel protein [Algibacter mikhailovii]|uniref:Outer membrane protein beta-barrel domain-containing protein n=1 Tax=Algibacter mikhailovii TaxID=425498 RepID=A0A918VDV5_9FLAO|nr:outer membrane beta-barrel protein [Algibacter mikhailovii]GGZ91748.1 hypothetical protein GCM10007028_32720 [Algibacter mikhailovii]